MEKKGSKQNYGTRHPLNLNWTLLLFTGILTFKLHSKSLHTQTGPAHGHFFSGCLHSSPSWGFSFPASCCFPAGPSRTPQLLQAWAGSLSAPSRIGNVSGAPTDPVCELQQEQGAERDAHISWSHSLLLERPGCSEGISALTAPSAHQQHPWADKPPPSELPQDNHTTKFTMRQVGTRLGAGSAALGVGVSPEPRVSHEDFDRRAFYGIIILILQTSD